MTNQSNSTQDTVFGMQVFVDPTMLPNELCLVSLTHDPFTGEMRQLDRVRLINIGPKAKAQQ